MIPTQEIYYNVTGQVLYYDAPEGKPSSMSNPEVFPNATGDDGTAEDLWSSVALSNTPDATVDVTSGAGETDPRKVNLTATSGVDIGGVYLLTGASGEREWVEVVEISSGAWVIARNPLHNSFAVSSTFETTRISGSINATWVADSGKISDDLNPAPGYRVRWIYVYDSRTYVKDTYFDMVRYKASHNVTPIDMVKFFPGWKNILPTYHQEDNGRSIIGEAYQQLKFDLYSHGLPDEMARDREAVDELVKFKARELLLFQRFFETGQGAEMAEEGKLQYQTRLDSLITITAKVPFASGTGGSATQIEVPSIWSR